MLDMNTVMVFSENPAKLAEFYGKVLGQPPGWSDDGYTGFQAGSSYLMICPHDRVKGDNATPERIMVNFQTPDVEGDFKRIKELGARVVAEPYHPGEDPAMTIATFADPDGNYFQLASAGSPS